MCLCTHTWHTIFPLSLLPYINISTAKKKKKKACAENLQPSICVPPHLKSIGFCSPSLNNFNCDSDKFCDKESGVRKVVLRGSIRNVVMAQQLIMDLVWEEMETAIGVMQFMIPDEVL